MKIRAAIVALTLLLVMAVVLPGCKKEVPLKDFPSLEALQSWLRSDGISERPEAQSTNEWYSKADELKVAAAKDGYAVTIYWVKENELYTVYCSAIVGGETWYWDPESDDLDKDVELVKKKWKPLE